MTTSIKTLSLAALAALLLAAPAAAAETSPGCKITTVTVKRPKTHRVHGKLRVVYHRVHGHRVPVMVVRHIKHFDCKGTTPPAATPAAAAPAPASAATKLKAHLDPSFVQDPSDPLKVTYSYSASATTEPVATQPLATPTALPEGVLNLYSDGSLACSINVGSGAEGGECPVAYQSVGAHTVVVTYESGSTTVTETSIETIEPFPTTTEVGAAYGSDGVNTLENCLGEGRCLWTIGSLKLTTAVRDGSLVAPGEALLEGAFIDGTKASSHTFQVTAETECVVNGSEHRIAVVRVILADNMMVVLSRAQAEEGTVEASASYAGAPGWMPSTGSAPVKFTPSLSAVYKKRNGEYVSNGCT